MCYICGKYGMEKCEYEMHEANRSWKPYIVLNQPYS